MTIAIQPTDSLDSWKNKINKHLLDSKFVTGFSIDPERTGTVLTPLDFYVFGGTIKNDTITKDIADFSGTLPDSTVSLIGLDARTAGVEALVLVINGAQPLDAKWIPIVKITVAAGQITAFQDMRPTLVM